jgi:hypothetical protein
MNDTVFSESAGKQNYGIEIIPHHLPLIRG